MQTSIEHHGHTTFTVSRGAVRILIDPILVRPDLELRRPTCPRWLMEDFTGVSAVFISHGHNDHLHPPSLLGLPREVPIYYLDEDAETCSCDTPPAQLLRELGFSRLHPFVPGQVISLGDEVKVHIIPARSSTEGEEQCAFLLETPDVLAFNGVDVRDTAVTRAALEPYRRRVDVAFVPTGASFQFQGFWNQMDAHDALAFCRWLQPTRIASCGGSVSLAERPRQDTLERYPNDFADWLALAAAELGPEPLIRLRPPLRLVFEAHQLSRCAPLQPDTRLGPTSGPPRQHALAATVFAGYHPRLPTKRWTWSGESLDAWLGPLQSARDVLQHAQGDLRALVSRCAAAANRSPAGILLPLTLRRAVEGQAWELAARLTAQVPRDADDVEGGLFAVAEVLVENAGGPAEPLLAELRACLWLDRGLFRLRLVSQRMRQFLDHPPADAERARDEHLRHLEPTLDGRRPVLTAHHLRLTRAQVPLLTGASAGAEVAGMLCYASPQGVRQHPLSELEAMVLESCDGRTFAELTAEVAGALEVPREEARSSLFALLARLSSGSVTLIDWSHP